MKKMTDYRSYAQRCELYELQSHQEHCSALASVLQPLASTDAEDTICALGIRRDSPPLSTRAGLNARPSDEKTTHVMTLKSLVLAVAMATACAIAPSLRGDKGGAYVVRRHEGELPVRPARGTPDASEPVHVEASCTLFPCTLSPSPPVTINSRRPTPRSSELPNP